VRKAKEFGLQFKGKSVWRKLWRLISKAILKK
jgi:hypothetical protein